MIDQILSVIGSAINQVTKSIFPNPEDELKRLQIENELQKAILAQSGEIQKAAGNIINTEAASSHWLAANWRPLTALIFVFLIVARWMGFSAPGMSQEEYQSVYNIIEVMIGGYTVSRGVEKIAPTIAGILKKP